MPRTTMEITDKYYDEKDAYMEKYDCAPNEVYAKARKEIWYSQSELDEIKKALKDFAIDFLNTMYPSDIEKIFNKLSQSSEMCSSGDSTTNSSQVSKYELSQDIYPIECDRCESKGLKIKNNQLYCSNCLKIQDSQSNDKVQGSERTNDSMSQDTCKEDVAVLRQTNSDSLQDFPNIAICVDVNDKSRIIYSEWQMEKLLETIRLTCLDKQRVKEAIHYVDVYKKPLWAESQTWINFRDKLLKELGL